MMDGFDPFAAPSPHVDPRTRALVLSFSSDWRFDPAHSLRLAEGLRRSGCEHVTEAQITSTAGHDSFLLTVPGYQQTIARFFAG